MTLGLPTPSWSSGSWAGPHSDAMATNEHLCQTLDAGHRADAEGENPSLV